MPNKQISFFIVILCFFLYGNTIFNGYNIDDENVVLNHPLASKGIKAIPAIFSSSYLEGYNANNERRAMGYRPVTVATFAIEHQFWGQTPAISHFINVLLYSLSCILLFRLLRRIFSAYNVVLPLLIVFLFIIHPIHTEVVNSLKNREDILGLLFALWSFSFFLDYVEKGKYWRIGLGLFLLTISFITKIVALPFLLLIPLTLYIFYAVPLKKGLLLGGMLIIPYVFFKIMRKVMVVSPFESGRMNELYENPLYAGTYDLLDRLAYAFYIFAYQVKLLFVPYPFRVYYGYNTLKMVGWDNYIVLISLALSLVLVGLAVYFYKKNKVVFWGILFFLSTAAMYVNLIEIIPGIIGERHLYVPSIGWAVLIAVLMLFLCRIPYQQNDKPLQWNYKLLILALLLLLPSAFLIIKRNTQWKDKLTILSHDIKKNKKSFKNNIMLAEVYASRKQSGKTQEPDEEKSAFYYKQALDIYPDNAQALAYYGGFLAKSGQIQNAIPLIHKALILAPNNGWANFFTGFIAHHNANYQEAYTYYTKALTLLPNEVDAYLNLGRVCYMLEKYDLAAATNKEGLRKFPRNEYLLDNLINVYYMSDNQAELRKYYQELININPSKAEEYKSYLK